MTRLGYRNEDEFQESIVAHAHANDWTVFWIHGWILRLAMSVKKKRKAKRDLFGHDENRPLPDKGFPDLILAHFGTQRLVAAECKVGSGRVEPDQKSWLALFKAAGIETYVWRDTDTDAIIDLLQHPARRS